MSDKGPTKRQLQARITKLEAELAKFKRGDQLRRKGEHWYELTEFFDAEKIKRVKSPLGATFLMGMLEDVFIIEYPANATHKELSHFMSYIRQKGIMPCLAVRQGVRFVKLSSVDEAREADLDAAEVADANDKSPAEQQPVPTVARSEHHGDGGDRDRSEDLPADSG
jgi:hypothetical protein